MSASFRLLTWSELSRDDVYALLALRQRVFVVEQACAFLDADGLDPRALHLLAHRGDALVACARLLPKGVADADTPAIGRVVTAPEVRGSGLGRTLMREALAACDALDWPTVRVEAQSHLLPFYASLGFVVTGPEYVEDGIPHVPMRRG